MEGLPPPGLAAAAALAALAIAGAAVLLPSVLQGDTEPPPTTVEGCPIDEPLVVEPQQELAHFPSIWGDWVAWVELIKPADTPGGVEGDIWTYHLPTGKSQEIASGPALQSIPEVYGSTVIWLEDSFDGNGTRFIKMDLETGETERLPLRPPLWTLQGFHGDDLLYDTGESLEVFNLSTEQRTRIVNKSVGASDIHDGRVVWSEHEEREDGNGFHIYLHDLRSNTTRELLGSDLSLSDPAIHGDTVVFMRGSEENRWSWDIYGLDLQANETFPIATDDPEPSTQQEPRIAGDWALYYDRPRPESRLDAYHVPTGTKVTAVSDGFDLSYDIWENRIAFRNVDPASGHKNLAILCMDPPTPGGGSP